MELKVKKPKVESMIKRMLNGDTVCQEILLKKKSLKSIFSDHQKS